VARSIDSDGGGFIETAAPQKRGEYSVTLGVQFDHERIRASGSLRRLSRKDPLAAIATGEFRLDYARGRRKQRILGGAGDIDVTGGVGDHGSDAAPKRR